MNTCFIIGHRDAPSYIQTQLDELLEYLVKFCDVSIFLVGYHGNFDTMATAAVQKAKRKYTELYLYRLLPSFPEMCSATLPEL